MNGIEVEMYLVGTDKDDAQQRFPCYDYDLAYEIMCENPGYKIYEVVAFVDFLTMEEVEE